MSKRELLARAVYHSGMLRAVGHLAPGSISVLTYHRIRSDRDFSEYPFDEDVFGPTQSCFEQQMKWLKNRLIILSESELLELMKHKTPGKGHFAVVTFDDGYVDNYELAYPVLRDLSLPAIFFISPSLLDERRLGWWDVIAYLVKRSSETHVELRGEILGFGEDRDASIRKLQGWMKSLPAPETRDLLETLSNLVKVPLPSREMQSGQLMTWEQVIEVSRGGIAIGSHTHTHRVLATLDEEEQRWEMCESKAALERRVGKAVRTLAYPAGSHGNFTTASMRFARESGYEGAFSFHSGGNRLGAIEPFDIHRISAAEELNPMFAGAAILPNLFAWAR
jgi:peptidoglycan/xylan/chitin deacetylase (PgdA/CDA1 family)